MLLWVEVRDLVRPRIARAEGGCGGGEQQQEVSDGLEWSVHMSFAFCHCGVGCGSAVETGPGAGQGFGLNRIRREVEQAVFLLDVGHIRGLHGLAEVADREREVLCFLVGDYLIYHILFFLFYSLSTESLSYFVYGLFGLFGLVLLVLIVRRL